MLGGSTSGRAEPGAIIWGAAVPDTVPPSDGQPEYLEQGSGGPLRDPAPSTGRRPRRPVLVTGAVIVGLGLVGGGVWAVTSFLATGAQPAEALPASTLAYASIDLDPSGTQKIEAMKTLRKFPEFRDKVGLDAGDDIREFLFEELILDTDCADLDYAADIEPWLGDRSAVAAVDTGADVASPVLVFQVTDEAAAEVGLKSLRECLPGSGDAPVEWVIDSGWALLAESADVAQATVDAAAEGSLADDADYQRWTDEVGDPGVMSFYAAPAAGRLLAQDFGGFASTSDAAEAVTALKDFGGAAATVRFSGGSLELEAAGDPGIRLFGAGRGSDALATLPEETAAAIGIGFTEGWFTSFVERVAAPLDGSSPEELMRTMSSESGLDLPADAETFTGDSLALAMGTGFDPERMFGSDPGGLPIAVKVRGDSAAIEQVLDKFRSQLGPLGGAEVGFLDSTSEGDLVAIGPDPDYRATVVGDGGLGETDVFRDVVREADRASLIGFVNFDAGDNWLLGLVDNDPDAAANLAPLVALGASVWQQDDTAHAVLRITTD